MSANDPRNLIAEKITLDDLQRHFGLDDRPDPAAFLEWQQDLPILTDDDRSRLDKAQAHYAHLSKRPILEAMVKMVILSPLLELAGFYDAPFYATSEASVLRTKHLLHPSDQGFTRDKPPDRTDDLIPESRHNNRFIPFQCIQRFLHHRLRRCNFGWRLR